MGVSYVHNKQHSLGDVSAPSASVLTSAIVTATYVAQFQTTLPFGELWRRWYGAKTVDVARLQAALSVPGALQTAGWTLTSGFFYPKKEAAWVRIREARASVARRKWQEVARAVGWLQLCPWIDGIFITGGLAMNSVAEDDDIDFCIVTSENRLWLTRMCVIFWAMVMRKRRSWQGEEPRSWCFNLWLDRTSLALGSSRQSPYEAYELLQAKPVFQRRGCLEDWYAQNVWVKAFAANWWSSLGFSSEAGRTSHAQQHQPQPLHFLLDGAEAVARAIEWWYMRAHRTVEEVTRGQAYFHPRPTRDILLAGWAASTTTYNDALAKKIVAKIQKSYSS